MLVARDDVLLLHRDLVDNLQGLLDTLFGLNRVFTPHPFHKWLEWEASLLPIKPDALVPRIRRLLTAAPRDAVDEVGALVEETFDLVAAHLPEFQIAPVRRAFASRGEDELTARVRSAVVHCPQTASSNVGFRAP